MRIMETGSDSDPELELEDQQARESTSAVPTTGSDTSTTLSLLDRLQFVQYEFFEKNLRIIGSFLKNTRLKFWESGNRIIGKILSIISQCLLLNCSSECEKRNLNTMLLYYIT